MYRIIGLIFPCWFEKSTSSDEFVTMDLWDLWCISFYDKLCVCI